MPKYIDPDLPFSRSEVQRAFQLAGVSRAEARELALRIAELPEATRAMNADADAARRRGSTDPNEINDASWYVGDALFALLACVSPRLAARAERLMAARWDEWTKREILAAMVLRRLPPGAEPPREVVIAARRKIAPWKAAWTRKRRRIARGIEAEAARAAGAEASDGPASRSASTRSRRPG